jgi:hypothetical protein
MSANLRQNGQPYQRATTLTENLKTLSKAIFPSFQTAANTCKLSVCPLKGQHHQLSCKTTPDDSVYSVAR